MPKKAAQPEYNAGAIQKLEGLEGVRRRPAMYIGDTSKGGLHHIAWELIDNVVDEYFAGHCNALTVRIDTKENRCTVADNGRGIPVEVHPQTGKSTLESIYTELHMGGKFGKQAYAISGGLHGVGSKATCALSSEMVAKTIRNGRTYRVGFSRGKVVQPLKDLGKAKPRRKGTEVSFIPDTDIFGKHRFDPDRFRERMEAVAFLCAGLKVVLDVNGTQTDLTSEDGLAGFLRRRLSKKEEPVFEDPLTFSVKGAQPDEVIDAALWWTDKDEESWSTYVNMIPVPDGGTHVTGAKTAIAKTLSEFCDDETVTGDDFRVGLRVALHLRLREPHFEGQTKNRLNNPECRAWADGAFREHLSRFLAQNPKITEMLVQRATALAKARATYKAHRAMATQTAYGNKTTRRDLPSQLIVALRCDASERELYIVEGLSAGGSAAQGRNGFNQEVLPLKGKPKNPIGPDNVQAIARIFENEAYRMLVGSIGAGHDVLTPGESCDPSKSRQSKVIIMADADADGGHIATLLVGFFLRFMLPLVEADMLWVALPPLFVAKWARGRVYGDTRKEVLRKAAAQGAKKPTVTRLKGLGEMTPDQLRETAMDPATRRIVRISADRESLKQLTSLLGSDAGLRKSILGLV